MITMTKDVDFSQRAGLGPSVQAGGYLFVLELWRSNLWPRIELFAGNVGRWSASVAGGGLRWAPGEGLTVTGALRQVFKSGGGNHERH